MLTHLLVSPYNKAGALTSCLPSRHRLHLNVSWVSQTVVSLNLKSCRKLSTEKWRSVSSAASTTHADKSCFEHLIVGLTQPGSAIETHAVRSLSLEDLLFDRSRSLESIDETFLLLPITPYTSQSLLIACTVCRVVSNRRLHELPSLRRDSRVPSGIKQDQTVGTDQVDTTSSSFTTEQEHKLLALGVVEPIDELLTLVDVHRSVET